MRFYALTTVIDKISEMFSNIVLKYKKYIKIKLYKYRVFMQRALKKLILRETLDVEKIPGVN